MTCSFYADRGRDHVAGGVKERNQFLSWRPRSSAIKAELRQYFAHVDTLYVHSRPADSGRTGKLVTGVLPSLSITLEGVHLHTRAMLHGRRSNQEAFKKEQDMLDSLDPELRVSGSVGRARDQRDPPVSEHERDAVLNKPCRLSLALGRGFSRPGFCWTRTCSCSSTCRSSQKPVSTVAASTRVHSRANSDAELPPAGGSGRAESAVCLTKELTSGAVTQSSCCAIPSSLWATWPRLSSAASTVQGR